MLKRSYCRHLQLSLMIVMGWFLAEGAMAQEAGTIKIWVKSSKGPQKVSRINLDGTYDDVLTSFDIQYDREIKVRGVRLRDLVAAFNPKISEADVALLHSVRGMIIPVSLGRLRRDQEVFIATRMMIGNKWSKAFPWGARAQKGKSKEIPVVFGANKLVVGKYWRATDKDGFTPWRFFDSLAGIEFVRSGKYFSQVEGRKETPVGGRLAYFRDCQYCHGVLGWGAKRAPDFAEINPGKDRKLWEYMLQNARNPGAGGFVHFMPAQESFKKKDAKDMESWVKRLKAGGLKSY